MASNKAHTAYYFYCFHQLDLDLYLNVHFILKTGRSDNGVDQIDFGR